MPSGAQWNDQHRRRALGNHFFQMAKAQRVRGVPTGTNQHHFQRIVQPLEHFAQLAYHRL